MNSSAAACLIGVPRTYSIPVLQASAIAVSNGWGDSFAQATASASVIQSCGWHFNGISG